MTDPDIHDNPAEHRYEARIDGEVAAVIEYQRLADGIRFMHTEVKPAFEGRGLGSKIARYALEDVRRRNLRASNQCQFIAGYIEKHPQYLAVIQPR